MTELKVRVQPNARRSEIVGWDGEVLRVRVAAAPVKGKANAELVDFLAETLGVRRSQVAILRGATSRDKVVGIDGMASAEVRARLLPLTSISSGK